MISNRSVFVILSLFLTLITIGSTAPVDRIDSVMQVLLDEMNEKATTVEQVAYDDDKNESPETSNEEDDDDELVLTTITYQLKTTTIPQVVTASLLSKDEKEALFDINDLIKLNDALLVDDLAELVTTTTTTENPQSDQLYAPIADEHL